MAQSPHPIKEIKISFHDAKGLTPPEPKQTPLPGAPVNNGPQDKVPTPQTSLDPLSEALFQGWGHANGLDPSSHDPSSPDNHYDFRGMFKATNGQVQPPGRISSASDTYNRLMSTKPDYASMGINPVASHPPQLTAPGMPSYGQALGSKVDNLQSEGADPNADPLMSLRRLLGR